MRHRPDCLGFLDLQAASRALDSYVHGQAQAAAERAGVLWQQYGEQSTFYFYHQARQRLSRTAWVSVMDHEGTLHAVDTPEHRSDAGRALSDFFSSASPTGLFRPGSVSEEAQEEILASVDRLLPESDARACEGLVTMDDLKASLDSMPRGKQPGSDGLPYVFYSCLLAPGWTAS